jgi:hypothetical protein
MHDLPCGDATRRRLPRLQIALAAETSCNEEGEQLARYKENKSGKEGEHKHVNAFQPQGLDTLAAVCNNFEQGEALTWAADLDSEPLAAALSAAAPSAINLPTTIAGLRSPSTGTW